MGGFKGGDENINRKGRPVGSKSEKTKVWDEISDWFANDALSLYKSNLLEMMQSEDKRIKNEAMKRYESLLEYFKPKLSRTEVRAEIETKDEIDLSNYSLEDLKKISEDNEDKD